MSANVNSALPRKRQTSIKPVEQRPVYDMLVSLLMVRTSQVSPARLPLFHDLM